MFIKKICSRFFPVKDISKIFLKNELKWMVIYYSFKIFILVISLYAFLKILFLRYIYIFLLQSNNIFWFYLGIFAVRSFYVSYQKKLSNFEVKAVYLNLVLCMGNGAVKCSECFVRASLIPNIVTAGFSNMTQCCFDSSKTVESTTVYFVSFIIHKIKY